MYSCSYPIASTLAWSSSIRTSCRRARTSGVSTAGLRMSPSSPPVQQTRTPRMPSAAYLATVPAPFDASSSGWACTDRRLRGASVISGELTLRTARRRLVDRVRRRRRARHVDLDPPDAPDPAAAQPLEREGRMVGERVGELGRHDDRLWPRDLDQPVRQVDHCAVVIALTGERGTAGHPGPGARQDLVLAGAVGELERDLQRHLGLLGDEHHLVADRLHQPAPELRDGVVGHALEAGDERVELLAVELLTERGVADE